MGAIHYGGLERLRGRLCARAFVGLAGSVLLAVAVTAGPVKTPVSGSPGASRNSGHTAAAACGNGTGIQVLGSGGPELDPMRASAGYLIWIDGKARALIDAGGGVFLRFAQAGARIDDLDVVALSHLHVDHSSDFPALLKAGYFSPRQRALPVLGPTGGGDFPGLEDWLRALLSPPDGAYHYLAGYLDGSDGLFALDAHEIDAGNRHPQTVFRSSDLTLRAIGVIHGSVPALGFLADVRGHKVAFSGDQNGNNPAFAAMISDAELLFMDYAVPEDTNPVAAALHARPSEIARLAAGAHIGTLVLSHVMARSERVLSASLDIISKSYRGPVTVAEDLMCWPLGRAAR